MFQERDWQSKLSILQQLLSNPSDLSSVSARLDTGEVSVLRPLLTTLNQEKAMLKDTDTRLFKIYKDEEERIKREHGVREKEIKERKEKLNADKVYLTECTEALAEQMESATSEQEKEEYEQDKKVVEEEWRRIEKDEQTIKNDENELSLRLKTETDKLQETRSDQVVELNKLRDRVKQKEQEWTSGVQTLIGDNTSQMNHLLSEVAEQESLLETLNEGHEGLVHRQEAEREEDEEKRLVLEKEKKEEEESFRNSLHTKEKDVENLREKQENFVRETASRKK